MKLTCTQDNFKKAILNCERVVSKHSTLPILNNILFEAKKGYLQLVATNLEIGVLVKMGAKIEKEGKITVPAKLISSFSSNLPSGGNVSLDMVDQGLKIRSGVVRAIIKGFSASDFPLIPQRSVDFLFSILALRLKDALSRVMICVGFHEARTELTGVNVILSQESLILAATDSFRLAEYRLDWQEGDVDAENLRAFLSKKNGIIIPANALAELTRIISNTAQETDVVKVAVEDGQVFFEINGIQIVSRLINGKYPEYSHIMPKEYKTRIVGEKDVVQGAVRMANVFSSGKANEITLKIDSQAQKNYISSKSVESGENITELNFETVGPSQEVIFNAKYLLDGISSIAGSSLAILFNSEATPVGIREINDQTGEVLDGYTYIVMPIKN